jgi:hypothetical protein
MECETASQKAVSALADHVSVGYAENKFWSCTPDGLFHIF